MAELAKFKVDSGRIVNYLVKEFEMRKSATEYKRITTSKSGDLDIRKLYAHTLTDDIFKKLDIIPEDKIEILSKSFYGYKEESLTPMKEQLGDDFSWEELRMFKASLNV